ncbi:MAG: SCO family protein [candidate division WOR-3 bacterium]
MNHLGACARLWIGLAYGITLIGVPRAQFWEPRKPTPPDTLLQKIGIDQKLNEQVPLHLLFRDETGQKVPLSNYFRQKPVILLLVYYECPMICNLTLNGLVKTLRVLSWKAGKEFEIVTVSINPKEDPKLAAQKKANYLKAYGRPEAAEGWHFLTGEESAIRQLADSVGFRYTYDPKTGQYGHAAGLIVLTPKGRISRYFYGTEFSARDLRFALIEASANKIGTPVEKLLLLCFRYDPTTGKYGLIVIRLVQLGGIATLLVLGTFMFVMFRRDRKQSRESRATGNTHHDEG